MTAKASTTTRCSAVVTLATAEAGIAALRENAARLAQDAELLMHARRYAAAAGMAASALLEIARIPVLLELSLAKSERQIRHCWSKFHGATPEFPWSLFQLEGSRMSDPEFNRMLAFIGSAGHRVDCLEGAAWTIPGQLLTADLAKELVRLASSFTVKPLEMDAVRLWFEIVAAFPKNSHDGALFDRFEDRLRAEGYTTHAGTLAQFVSRAAGARLAGSTLS